MSNTTAFHEVRFPTDISFGSSGGPERQTDIVTLGSGREHRNQKWSQSRRRYEAGYGVKDLDGLHRVIAFYEARRGPLHGFRYRDPLDWKSCAPLEQPTALDQLIGYGDGLERNFSLKKTYGDPPHAYERAINKPAQDSVVIALDGAVTSPASYSVDAKTGLIEFLEGHEPGEGVAVTAGFEFDVPVRFASDQLDISLSAFTAGTLPSIPLLEIKL